MTMSEYGKRGGTSATAGRKSVLYRATAQDGSVLEKRSFKAGDEIAVMNVYLHEGKWYPSCVYNESNKPGWFAEAGRINIEARRV